MLILTTSEAIGHAIAHYSLHLPFCVLERYATLLKTNPIAWVIIIQPGDTASALEEVRGRPFEGFEFIDKHDQWFEVCIILSDDGWGHCVLLADEPGIDPELLEICRTFAPIGE